MLHTHLLEYTKNKTSFSLSQLKRDFPREKKQIAKYVFLGLIEPINCEVPDQVRAHIYEEQS